MTERNACRPLATTIAALLALGGYASETLADDQVNAKEAESPPELPGAPPITWNGSPYTERSMSAWRKVRGAVNLASLTAAQNTDWAPMIGGRLQLLIDDS